MEDIAIVLAMHGAPPLDFPPQETAELFMLHERLEHASQSERSQLEQRYHELDRKMRDWPRTPDNDPFYAGSRELARELQAASSCPVILAFNEFCAPDLDQALDDSTACGRARIVVVTAMLTRGGEHAEAEIPAAVERARQRHPGCDIVYAWPFDSREVAQLLASQIQRFK